MIISLLTGVIVVVLLRFLRTLHRDDLKYNLFRSEYPDTWYLHSDPTFDERRSIWVPPLATLPSSQQFVLSLSLSLSRPLCAPALRPGVDSWVVVTVRATRFPRVRGHGGLEVCKRPWSFRGPRGYAPIWADGRVCRLLYDVQQMLSLCSLYCDSPLSTQPELLVHVPAAMRECRGRKRAGNPSRPTVPTNGGLQPKDWQALFLNNVGFQESILDFGGVRGRLWQLCSGWVYVGIGRRVPIVLSCFPSLLSSSTPGCLRCIFRLDGPAQGLEDSTL